MGTRLSRQHFLIAKLEKLPSGGVLVHVRTAEAESHLVGQEVNLLGKKFKLKRQSILVRKFFLDVSGIHSSDEADTLAVALSAKGARVFYWTPRDVNIKMKIATPTWRFYFGSTTAPSCLVVHQYVTHQLACGKKLYLARGKHNTPPPTRCTTYKLSAYAVQLPFGSELDHFLQKPTECACQHCAAGFKHGEFELADENPYPLLESEECDFDVFQPEITPKLPEAVVMVQHLHKKERPKKKGPGSSPVDRDRDEAVLKEALLQSHEEALLMLKPDHVKANIEHYHASETLLMNPETWTKLSRPFSRARCHGAWCFFKS
ncbi:unnamed protein product [Phytophthora lilii]|uniref:Unnamed protein product n=1 Tax=Phytophthora lilii TaxID=2077276 RepID=A0A9W6YKN8_9STRA|nr:unnamed protein product [Phytophthora lilii]